MSIRYFIYALIPGLVSSMVMAAGTDSIDPPSPLGVYRKEIADLHVARRYVPMKNSFVLGLETQSDRPQLIKPDQRKTILQAEGCGSLRHIWETHGTPEGIFELQFFIDGESEPSIRGTLTDLITAAQQCENPYIENTGGRIANNSHNLYLPVPFEKSLRIDLIPLQGYSLIFLQLDYRLEDDSMKGVRLVQKGRGADMRLVYEGAVPKKKNISIGTIERIEKHFLGNDKITIQGPAVIRRLAFNNRRLGVRLQIRYDDASTPAVDVDLADFLGPFRGVVLNNNRCYFPMPFKKNAVIELVGAHPQDEWAMEIDVEKVARFEPDWRYFHAQSILTPETTGYDPHRVLYTHGSGHWVGLSLYEPGHDHGGGDIAVIDGETKSPAFLHGINGEDYFSFAFFGKGENFPYSEAFDNDTGRMRLHLESPYPFEESIFVGWYCTRKHHPHTVAYWYQDGPENKTLTGQQARGLKWQVFGPVYVPVTEDGNTLDVNNPDGIFAQLPDPARLDAGQEIGVYRTFGWDEKHQAGTYKGWATQYAIGPFLDLMYVYRHVMDLGGASHMAYEPRAMMAQTTLTAEKAREVTLQISFDDPLEIVLNGQSIYFNKQLEDGFVTEFVKARLQAGDNRLLIRMTDTPNSNTCWAAINLRILDDGGRDITAELMPEKGSEPVGK